MENNNDEGITTALINEILVMVKLELGLTDTSKDELLTLYIKIICHNIVIKTNRRTFPEKLKYVVVDLVTDKFNMNNKDNPELNSIQSMSEYDRSVSFGASDALKIKLNAMAKAQLEANENLINKFKLLYRT